MWVGFRGLRPGRLSRLGALLALLGFLFAATNPGLPQGNAFDLGAVPCHAPGSSAPVLPDDDAPRADDDCCLNCQAAQLAKALPPPRAVLPLAGAIHVRLPASARLAREGEAARHAQARAPPAV